MTDDKAIKRSLEALFKDPKFCFDQAYNNLSPIQEHWTANDATLRAAMAQILMAEGLVAAARQIEERATAASKAAAEASAANDKKLADWTAAQGWLTAALTFFAAVQVIVAVLEYLKP